MYLQAFALIVVGLLAVPGVSRGEGPAARLDKIAIVARQLSNPRGVAVRPGDNGEANEIFVAEAGSGRVVRFVNGEKASRTEVITGFAALQPEADASRSAGPRGLLFLDRMRLVVAGGDEQGQGFVRLYELRDADASLTANKHAQQVAPRLDGGQGDVELRSFCGLARTLANDSVDDLLIVAALNDQRRAALWKIPVRANTLGELARFGLASPSAELTVPPAVAVGPHGYLVVSETPAGNRESRLKFCNPMDGTVALEVAVELPQIVDLAYSPATGNLYAISFVTGGDRGGLFRLDDSSEPGQPAAAAVQLAEISRPTAMAFNPDGALYVTALGESDGDAAEHGMLWKITGEL